MNFRYDVFASVIVFLTFFVVNIPLSAQTSSQIPTGLHDFYDNSYALVIGIDKYSSEDWQNLDYAVKDAKAMANFLENQGFKVITLYDKEATRGAIETTIENNLAPQLKKNDRVLLFFAGHGHTKSLGGRDWGYIVPSDANNSGGYISMEELTAFSEKMGNAKHQLFIMDACYGGLIGTRGSKFDKNRPDYLEQITMRKARQYITAGGANQIVADGGPNGHSYFTGYLLEALQESMADSDRDGYITFDELCSYLIPSATTSLSTPANGELRGHGQGEFVFRSPKGRIILSTRGTSASFVTGSKIRGIEMVTQTYDSYNVDESMYSKFLKNAEDWFYWGLAEAESNQNYMAMNKGFDKALNLDPKKKIEFQGEKVRIKDAVEQYRTSRFATVYNSAIKIIPQAQESEDSVKKKELLEQAKEKLALAIEFHPSRVEPYRPLAMVNFNLGDTTQAEAVLEDALNKFPKDENLLLSTGEIYDLTGQHDKAEELYKRVLHIDPSNSSAYQRLGIMESNRENWAAAKEYYAKAIETDPNNTDLAYNIGVSLYNQSKFEEAIPYFKKSLEFEPDNEVIYTILAGCYVRSETKIDEGIVFLENAVQRYPKDSGLWEFLAVLYGRKGIKDKAEAAFRKSQELKGN